MQNNRPIFDDFLINLIDRLVLEIERNELDQTGEIFWFNIYEEYPLNEKIANRSNDRNVRALVGSLVTDNIIDLKDVVDIQYRPNNVSVKKASKIFDAIQIQINEFSSLKLYKDHASKMKINSRSTAAEEARGDIHTGASGLSAVSFSIGDYNIHESGLVSFEGQLIDMPNHIRKIAVYIMEKSHVNDCASSKELIDNCLSEEYKEKVGKSGDENRSYNYLRSCISQARSMFKRTSAIKKNNFVVKRDIGYKFVP